MAHLAGLSCFVYSRSTWLQFFDKPSHLDHFLAVYFFCVYPIQENDYSSKLLQIDSNYLTLNYFLISFIMLALVSISLSMSEININDPFIDIMTFLSRFTPLVMVMLIFSVFVRIILKQTLSIVPVGLRTIIFRLRDRFDLPKATQKRD